MIIYRWVVIIAVPGKLLAQNVQYNTDLKPLCNRHLVSGGWVNKTLLRQSIGKGVFRMLQ